MVDQAGTEGDEDNTNMLQKVWDAGGTGMLGVLYVMSLGARTGMFLQW
jgi:hypothetical protein